MLNHLQIKGLARNKKAKVKSVNFSVANKKLQFNH
jgi:hypothetical protein